jgi:hypothetical protein
LLPALGSRLIYAETVLLHDALLRTALPRRETTV